MDMTKKFNNLNYINLLVCAQIQGVADSTTKSVEFVMTKSY